MASVEEQVKAIDNMLLNAYGTSYKFAAKSIVFVKVGHDFSPVEELLTAKNILSNLWSVLDHCSFALYSSFYGTPMPKVAREIKFQFKKNENELNDWAKKKLNLGGKDYHKFVDALRDVPLKDPEVDATSKEFHRLHYLRNLFTHRTVDIIDEDLTHQKVPNMLKKLGVEPEISLMINVPEKPWSDLSNAEEPVPLLNVLMRSCKIVEVIRDKLLSQVGGKKFKDKFDFVFNEEMLEITAFESDYKIVTHYDLVHLHLKCYGLDGENNYKQRLEPR